MTKSIEILNNSVKKSLDLFTSEKTASVFGDELRSVEKSVKQIAWKAKKIAISKTQCGSFSLWPKSGWKILFGIRTSGQTKVI